MNDYWNDPPEDREEDSIYFSDPEPEGQPIPEPFIPQLPKNCPHGNDWADCGQCDHLADLAFDAAREQRMRRR